MNLAPIYVATCRRPNHFLKLIETLQANPESWASTLNIVVGGPKNAEDWPQVQETLRLSQKIQGFAKVVVHEKFELVTGSSLIQYCVSSAFENNDTVIVLEDDLIVRADFLNYMNSALNFFRFHENVIQVCGWNFGTISSDMPKETYLFPISIPWGWGTWKTKWNPIPQTANNFEWLIQKNARVHKFNFSNNYNCLGMIEAILQNNYDAWDAACYLDNFRNQKLTVYPNSSLIINTGFDGSGLNFTKRFRWEEEFSMSQQTFDFCTNSEVSPQFKKFLGLHKKWIKASFGWSQPVFMADKLLRIINQHKKYAKKGYYTAEKN